MRDLLHKIVFDIQRHRKVQIALTAGTLVGALLYYLWPDRGELVVACNICTNAIWIWSE